MSLFISIITAVLLLLWRRPASISWVVIVLLGVWIAALAIRVVGAIVLVIGLIVLGGKVSGKGCGKRTIGLHGRVREWRPVTGEMNSNENTYTHGG